MFISRSSFTNSCISRALSPPTWSLAFPAAGFRPSAAQHPSPLFRSLRQKRLQQESVAVFHQHMPQIAQLRLASPGLRPQSGNWIGAGFIGLVLALYSAKVGVSSLITVQGIG